MYAKEEIAFVKTRKICLPCYFYINYLRLQNQSDFHKQQIPTLYLHDSIKRYIIYSVLSLNKDRERKRLFCEYIRTPYHL